MKATLSQKVALLLKVTFLSLQVSAPIVCLSTTIAHSIEEDSTQWLSPREGEETGVYDEEAYDDEQAFSNEGEEADMAFPNEGADMNQAALPEKMERAYPPPPPSWSQQDMPFSEKEVAPSSSQVSPQASSAHFPLLSGRKEEGEKMLSRSSLKAEDLNALVAELKDDKSRDQLIKQLETLVSLQERHQEQHVLLQVLERMTQQVSHIALFISGFYPTLKTLPEKISRLALSLQEESVQLSLLNFSKLLGISLICALFFNVIAAFFSQKIQSRMPKPAQTRLPARGVLLVVNLVCDALPPIAFYVGGLLPLFTLHAEETHLKIVEYIILMFFLMRLGRRMVHLVFSPMSQDHRYVEWDDLASIRLARSLTGTISLIAVSYALVHILSLLGMDETLKIFIVQAAGLLVTIMLMKFVFSYHEPMRSWFRSLRTDDSSRLPAIAEFADFISEIWHFIAAFSILGIYIAWALDLKDGSTYLLKGSITTLVVIIGARIVSLTFHRVLISASPFKRGETSRKDKDILDKSTKTHNFQRLDAFLHLSLYVGSLFLILEAWGVSPIKGLKFIGGENGPYHLAMIAIIVAIMIMAWEMAHAILDYYTKKHIINGREKKPSQRFMTFYPLLRSLLHGVIIIVGGIVILAHLGMNVTSLIAGLSVLGVAFALGSQKLAQDIISGCMLLAEDTIEVGDVIKVGAITGKVISFSMRALELRGSDGTLYCVPYSEVSTISNLSKDYSSVTLEIKVGHEADMRLLTALVEETSREMMGDELVKPKVLEEIKVIGVSALDDTSTTLMATMKTEPDPYKLSSYEFKRRLKHRLLENNIPMPAMSQVIRFEDGNGHLKMPIRVIVDNFPKE